MHATIQKKRCCATPWIGARLLVLVIIGLAFGDVQAAPRRYASSVAYGQVFRDANGDRQLMAPGEQVATTGEDGSFTLRKGKGRIFIQGGQQIPGGGDNTTLLTAPPAARSINTLTSLWQALLHRKQGAGKIKKMLNVPANVTLVNYAAKPIEKVKPKSKAEKVVKRDAQHRTLVSFLKGLAGRGRQGLRATPARLRAQAEAVAPLQDEEIRALAEALIARLEGLKKKQWTPTDLADPPTLDSGFKTALSQLGIEPPAQDDLNTVVDAAAFLNGQIDQTDASRPEQFTALVTRGVLEAKLIEQGRYDELAQIASEVSTVILGIDPDTGALAGDGLTNDPTPAVFGLAEAAAVKVRLHLDQTVQDLELDVLGQWTFSPAAGLAEGPHTVTVEGLDAAGNVLPNTASFNVIVDVTPPPDPTVTTSLQTSDTTPVLSGNWDPAAGNSLTVTVGETPYAVGADLVTDGGSWTLTLPAALADGSYPVTVTATDAAGNASEATATLTVDTVAPAAPTVNGQLARTATPTLSGTWDSAAGNTLAVTVDGQSYQLGGGALTASGNAWFLAIPAALADGGYTVTATGSDAAGNVGPSATATLTIDTLAPGAPVVNSQLTSDTTPTVTGNWDPAEGNDLSVTLNDRTYTRASGIATAGSSWSVTVTQALAEGSHTVTATASDPAGNLATATGMVTVDTTPPPIPTVAVLEFSTTTPTLTGTCSVADTAGLTVQLNGKTYTPACVNDAELGESWLLSLPATDALRDGNFPLVVTATDAAGNDRTVTYTLAITGTAVREAIITTAAGGGVGDGGPATATSLYNPQAVAVDGQGNVYLADAVSPKVRRIAPDGTITTVAGNGDFNYNGDGGSAVAAALWQPWALAVDAGGNLYIADSGQSRVRKVDTAGIITTVAGNGAFESSGDGGLAVDAGLGAPSGLAIDVAGNLYIADSSFNVVRRVEAATGIITTVAGGGTAGTADGIEATLATLSSPSGLALDAEGNLYLADTGHHLVRRVAATNGIITTVAGDGTGGFLGDDGPATRARLNLPAGLSFDGTGRLLIADRDNHRIRRIDGDGNITTAAGEGTAAFAGDGGAATAASLTFPVDVAANGGEFYIADNANNRIRRVDADGIITTVGGNGETSFGGDDGPAIAAMISSVSGLAADPANGEFYLSDSGNGRIRRVDAGGTITTVAGDGSFDYGGDGGPATAAALSSPSGIALDGSGNLYIADTYNQRIRRVDRQSGDISTVAGNGTSGFAGDGQAATEANLNYPQAVAVFGTGELYIADGNNGRVRRVDLGSGIITTVAGGGSPSDGIGDGLPATEAALSFPEGVAVDGSGNLYLVDSGNSRVRRVDRTSGIITTVAGGGSASPGDGGPATDAALDLPTDVAVDAAGNIYIAEGFSESGGNRIRKVDADGIITTVAGNGGIGFSGDGGPAAQAALHNVQSVAVDGAGTVYVGDSGNGRVRRVVEGTVAFADGFSLDGSTREPGSDLGGLAVETSSVGFAAWTSVGGSGAGNVLGGDTANGYAVPQTGTSQPYTLATLPFSLGSHGYSISAKVFPEAVTGVGPAGSAGVGFFQANGAADLPLTSAGTTALALLVDGSGSWRLITGAETFTVLLSGTVIAGEWSAAAPPPMTLRWDTARHTASGSLGGVSLFENFELGTLDPGSVQYVGFGCDGPLGGGAVVDDFRLVELP